MKTLTRTGGSSVEKNLALLILRVVCGGFLMGHGAQKLFGWFKGPGMNGTSMWLESLGMRPGKFWAALAGGSEFGGGLLTVLGFLNPIGPLASFGAMAMATVKAHLGKPIWASQGGAEFPLTNLAITSALMTAGPGEYSVDGLLGTRLPRWLLIPGLLGVASTVAYGYYGKRFPQLQRQVQQALQTTQQTVQQTVQQAAQRTIQTVQRATPGAQTATPTGATRPTGAAGTAGSTGSARTSATTGTPGTATTTGRTTQPAGSH